MSLVVLGIGSATPPRQIAQTDAARLAIGFANAAPGHEKTLAAIYRQTRIQTRGSVLLEEPGDEPFQQSFFPPSSGSPTAGIDAAAITHLVTCSCTGFSNPGVDLEIVAALGLPMEVSRTHVGFMGCHGAFNALRVADGFAATASDAVVLVCCVELCSLHFQYGSRSDAVVANSIFADGAAAIVGIGADHLRAGDAGWRLDRSGRESCPIRLARWAGSSATMASR